jgi:hypothetical protein
LSCHGRSEFQRCRSIPTSEHRASQKQARPDPQHRIARPQDWRDDPGSQRRRSRCQKSLRLEERLDRVVWGPQRVVLTRFGGVPGLIPDDRQAR